MVHFKMVTVGKETRNSGYVCLETCVAGSGEGE